ncbi:MAG: glycosyltransferase [Gammaproteobacteria bacterium]|nr:glycosyltransferase [Gammaproteobacteria bacterium]
MRKLKVLFIQPVLASYRDPMFKGLAKIFGGKLVVCAGKSTSEFGAVKPNGYGFIEVSWRSIGGVCVMPMKEMYDCFRSSYKIIHVADFKFLSLWVFLVLSFFFRKKIWLHGQGGYKKSGFLHRCVYTLSVAMSSGYICYSEYSRGCLEKVLPRRLHRKISVVENTLYIEPVKEVTDAKTSDIFYIGRLRDGCGLEVLLDAAQLAGVKVRVIGGGEDVYLECLKRRFQCAIFYGGVFGREEQLEIAKNCMLGAYGGDAGLSVVHYMAFGLPVLVHSSAGLHMGPEPTYVKDDVNGLMFERNNPASLAEKILVIKNDTDLRDRLARGALDTFNNLRVVSMEEKFANIIGRE